MKQNDPNLQQRLRELLKQKRRVLNRMKKSRKSLARDRVEKKHINEEIARIRKSGFAFAGMTAVEAQTRVSGEIQAVGPEDIYPKDLEKKFDKLERTTEVRYKKDSVDISDVENDVRSSGSREKDDEGIYSITLDQETGVVDLSETETDELAEPVLEEDDAE